MKRVPLGASVPNGKCALNALATLPVGGPPLSRSWTFALLRHLDFKAELDLSLSRGDCRWEGLGGAVGVVIADRGGRSCVMMLVMSGGCLPSFLGGNDGGINHRTCGRGSAKVAREWRIFNARKLQ